MIKANGDTVLYIYDFRKLLPSQRSVAMISEMIHTASLVHDDVIDQADMRRGKPSAPALWDHKKVSQQRVFILWFTYIASL